MIISSSAFQNNSKMPEKYGYNTKNINPPLIIKNIPNTTKSLVLTVDDPDASTGDWVHWILFNIPLVEEIKENSIPKGSAQGLNSWNSNKYDGPCPPSGTHRYFFKLYALDTELTLKNPTKKEILRAMQHHIVGYAELIGLFSKI